jgi:hypothetical protein
VESCTFSIAIFAIIVGDTLRKKSINPSKKICYLQTQRENGNFNVKDKNIQQIS